MSLPELESEFGMYGKQRSETIFIIIFEATINTERIRTWKNKNRLHEISNSIIIMRSVFRINPYSTQVHTEINKIFFCISGVVSILIIAVY